MLEQLLNPHIHRFGPQSKMVPEAFEVLHVASEAIDFAAELIDTKSLVGPLLKIRLDAVIGETSQFDGDLATP